MLHTLSRYACNFLSSSFPPPDFLLWPRQCARLSAAVAEQLDGGSASSGLWLFWRVDPSDHKQCPPVQGKLSRARCDATEQIFLATLCAYAAEQFADRGLTTPMHLERRN